jgi:hypothetical protein
MFRERMKIVLVLDCDCRISRSEGGGLGVLLLELASNEFEQESGKKETKICKYVIIHVKLLNILCICG